MIPVKLCGIIYIAIASVQQLASYAKISMIIDLEDNTMKKLTVILSLLLIVGMLTGCAGTPVIYYTECNCPEGAHVAAPESAPAEKPAAAVPAEGALKTGLALIANVGDSKSATAEALGEGKYDVTMVAVLVDDQGVIQDCLIDGISDAVTFNNAGQISTNLSAPFQTKNEKGENYGMVAYGGAIAEWDAQAAALAQYAVGKTVDELKNGAIDETGYAPEGSDLASSATIYLGGYVSAIEKAAANAKHLGAQAGDILKMAATTAIDSSKNAAADGGGVAQLDVNLAALTVKGDVITSCALDAVQAKVKFDVAGQLTEDVSAPVLTKNELGENYGMVAYGGAIAEWDAQAAAFASYVTGKTVSEVAGIAVDETTKPTDADLVSSVTIKIGGFQELIAKACR